MSIDLEARRRRQKEYYLRRKAKDPEGLKAALNAATMRWRNKNPGKQQAAVRAWRARNPEYAAQWRERNRERWNRMARESKYGSKQRYPAPENCEKCGERMADTTLGPQFDHDHVTKFHRGWLCNKCNNGIARLGDTIEGLKEAIAYLERAEAAWKTSILA